MDTKGDRALAPIFRFNLFDFCDLFDELFPFFNSAVSYACDIVHSTQEYMADAWRYELENSDYE